MRLHSLILVAACAGGIAGCSSSSSDSSSAVSETPRSNPAPSEEKSEILVTEASLSLTSNLGNVGKVLNTNADIAYAAYSDAVDTATALQGALATFKASPTQANLDAAKMAWLVSREPYGQTEVYRFRLSPIDSTNYADEDGPEGDINAWPLGEALIDYVVAGDDFTDAEIGVTEHATGVNYPTENIINSNVVIDASLVANTATAGDEHDVISGYHGLEFMLWGQDLNSDGNANTQDNLREQSSPGNILNSGGHRPLSDFTTAPYAARRHQYLEVVAAKLVADLTAVRDAWAVGANYRTAFTTVTTQAEAATRLAEILTGMGTLSEGELAGERMQISFSSGSQEDEHSCFSDNTHRDIWLNAEGISNSYYGEYAGFDSTLDGVDNATARAITGGYGLDDLLLEEGLSLEAGVMDTVFTATEVAYKNIDASARAGSPVDVLIMSDNLSESNPMYMGILALFDQSNRIAELANSMGITGVVDPDASACVTSNPLSDC